MEVELHEKCGSHMSLERTTTKSVPYSAPKICPDPPFLAFFHGTRSVLYDRELRSFVVVLCPREFWFRSRIFGPFVV